MFKGIMSIVSSDCMRNFLAMANTEAVDIVDLPEKLFSDNPEKFFVLYAKNDKWCDEWIVKHFQKRFGDKIDHAIEDDLLHAWVEDPNHIDIVLKHVLQKI